MPLVSRIFHRILYDGAKNVARIFFTLGWRLSVQGKGRIPRKGPVIFAAHHRSYADPPLIGSTVPRDVHFLAKRELFNFRPFGWLIGQLNAHPLNRKAGDVGAIRAAQRLLKDGHALIVFPEGRRSKTDNLARPKAGVGMLAFLASCPVVPTYIHNSGHLVKFRKVIIRFGPPLYPHTFDSYQALAEGVMRQIQKMKEEIW